MKKVLSANQEGWNRNTALCVNLKTILRRERMMKPGKGYTGVLKRDVISLSVRIFIMTSITLSLKHYLRLMASAILGCSTASS